jgi:hypothetical protein
MEKSVIDAFANEGIMIHRGRPYDETLKHGFIWSQKMGVEGFKRIPRNAPLIVAEAVWQYSHHILSGLREYEGPDLTLANWSGDVKVG